MKNKEIDKVKTQDQKFSCRDFLKSTTAVGLGITIGSSELLALPGCGMCRHAWPP